MTKYPRKIGDRTDVDQRLETSSQAATKRNLVDAQSWLKEDGCGTESAACYSRPCHRRRTVNRGLPAGLVVAQPVDLGRLPRGPAHILTP